MTAKVVIVTGSSSGIGAATALAFARRGWGVVVNYSKDEAKATKVAAECMLAMVVKADIGEDEQCRRLAQAAIERWGRIDALVNNAGTTRSVAHANLDGLSADDFLQVYKTNVVGPFQMARACADALRENAGAIVNVSSLGGLRGTGSSIAYAASKAALNTMTMSLARVLAPQVRVNAVCPGFVDTPWSEGLHGAQYAAAAEKYKKNAPLRSISSAEDVAGTILWLVESARMTTGETLYVDGGMHIAVP